MGHKPHFRDIPLTVSHILYVTKWHYSAVFFLPCVSQDLFSGVYTPQEVKLITIRGEIRLKKNQIYFKIKNMHNVLFILLFFPIPTIESWVVIFFYLYSNILYSANPQSVLKCQKINKQLKSGPDSPTAPPPSTEIPGLPKMERCLIIHHSASIVHPVSLQVSEGAPVHACLPLGKQSRQKNSQELGPRRI